MATYCHLICLCKERIVFEYLVLNEHQAYMWNREIRVEVDGDSIRYRRKGNEYGFPRDMVLEGTYKGDGSAFLRKLESLDVSRWSDAYLEPALEGYGWNLRYKEVGKPCKKTIGFNCSPERFHEFLDLSLLRQG